MIYMYHISLKCTYISVLTCTDTYTYIYTFTYIYIYIYTYTYAYTYNRFHTYIRIRILRGAWPRRPLPEELVDDLKKRLKLRVTLASNPCRVLFYNHEMVFFRDDIMKRSQVRLYVYTFIGVQRSYGVIES